MTESQRQALLMFTGTMHGLAKQADEQVVGGRTPTLQPISNSIQNVFERVLNTRPGESGQTHGAVEQQQYTPVAEPYIPHNVEPTLPYVPYEQAAKELEAIAPQNYKPNVSNTVQVDSNLIEVLKEISLNLGRIATKLESNVSTSKRIKVNRSA